MGTNKDLICITGVININIPSFELLGSVVVTGNTLGACVSDTAKKEVLFDAGVELETIKT